MKENSPKISPYLVLTVGVLAVSTGSIFIRFAQSDAHSLVISLYRLGLALILLAPVALARRRQELQRLAPADWRLGLLAGVFLALHFATWITSLEYTSVTSSVVFVNTSPLWVALVSPFALHERLSRRAWVGVGVAFLGGLVVGLSDACSLGGGGVLCPSFDELLRGRAMWGNFLALLGAWALAGYLMVGRRLRPKVSLTGYIFVVYGIAALVMLGVVLAAHLPLTGFAPQTYVWLLLLALLPQLLGHSASNYALAFLPASFVAVALLGEPVGSTILAGIVLHEVPSLMKVAGAALTLVGIYLVSRAE